jgi:hypothetical protein
MTVGRNNGGGLGVFFVYFRKKVKNLPALGFGTIK